MDRRVLDLLPAQRDRPPVEDRTEVMAEQATRPAVDGQPLGNAPDMLD